MEIKKFKIGQKVKSDYIELKENVIRTITEIKEYIFCGSGILISTDGGENGTKITLVDSDWIKKLKNKK